MLTVPRWHMLIALRLPMNACSVVNPFAPFFLPTATASCGDVSFTGCDGILSTEEQGMAFDDEIAAEIAECADRLVRLGSYTREVLIESIGDEFELEGGTAEVASAVDRAIAAWRRDQRTWPAVTDWDRLDVAFTALEARGVLAMHVAGYTQSEGYEDVMAAYARRGHPAGTIGYCFYHGQDAERAMAGGGLYLAFGPIDPALEAREGPRIGAMVAEAVEAQGFTIAWNGTFAQRLHVRPFVWQRRERP